MAAYSLGAMIGARSPVARSSSDEGTKAGAEPADAALRPVERVDRVPLAGATRWVARWPTPAPSGDRPPVGNEIGEDPGLRSTAPVGGNGAAAGPTRGKPRGSGAKPDAGGLQLIGSTGVGSRVDAGRAGGIHALSYA